MARIRSIKPEFWTSEQVMECSTNARLLFIGLWNFCDDAGRMPLSPKRIKAQLFPSDDILAEDIRRMIDELSSNGLLRLYDVDGKEFLAVTGWHHQKIDRPQKSQIPDPPDPNSPNGRRTIGVGREGNGVDRKGDKTPAAASHPARPTLNQAKPAAGATTEAAGPSRAEGWNTRANFDRVEARVRSALDGGPQDLRIGPIAKLEADGLDLEAEIIPALLDIARSSRVPIRTWAVYADRVAERVTAQRQGRVARGLAAVPDAPTPPEEMIDLGVSGRWPEPTLRKWIERFRADAGAWSEAVLGPPPGQPGCRIPPRLLLEAA
ncbi:hypothetical protein [Methylobacterium sp. SI9]|uniref:hypothetical protein n=1 Tax=Methylobacterium guangdongense TaxID=3138811 RepID=UPI00313E6A09